MKRLASLALAIAITAAPAGDALAAPDPAPASAMPRLTASRHAPVMTGTHLPYRGWFWRPAQRAYTLCVLKRESNLRWFAVNRPDGYFGGFQLSAALARGATWMITPELRAMYGDRLGRRIARQLRATPMHRWRPLFQQMAFATVLNWTHDGSGAHHWAGGRWACALPASTS